MNAYLTALANHFKENDPVMAISNLCLHGSPAPDLIEEAKRILKFNQCGWLDTPEQCRETAQLCALVRTEWDSESKQKPATAALELMKGGSAEKAAPLLGFAPSEQRTPLLTTLLDAMLRAPHRPAADLEYMFGAQ